MYVIPLTPDPNQTFRCVIPVDGENLPLRFGLRYNGQAGYWTMRITDDRTGELLIDSLPILTGEYPAANLLAPYSYLKIGSAVVVPVGPVSEGAEPDGENLGISYQLVWGDTIA